MSIRAGQGELELDPDVSEAIEEFFTDLVYPNSSDPNGWFQALPAVIQAEKRAFAKTWHLRNWFTLRASVEKPTL